MHSPYGDTSTNRLYAGLFCDQPEALMPPDGKPLVEWQRTLRVEPADPRALRALATDASADARVRAMAWRRLQQLGHAVPPRHLLGVVLEVPLGSGLDTLAAYADGSVRFIHGSGHMSFVEGGPDGAPAALQPLVATLMEASQAIVDRIGPWHQPRLAPPSRHVRMSFVVSDGLYFGEGPMDTLMADPMASPVLRSGIALLDEITSMAAA